MNLVTPTIPPPPVVVQADEPAGRGQALARVLFALALVALGAYVLEGFLRALLWAVILAVATWPLRCRLLARLGAGRHNILVPALLTVGATLIFVVPLALLAVQASHDVRALIHWVNEARHNGVAAPEWLGRLPFGRDQATAWWEANLHDPAGATALLGRVERSDLMQTGRQVGSALIRRGVLFGFTLLTLFFLYRDGEGVVRRLRAASLRLVGRHGEEVGRQMIASIHGTVNGMVLVGLGVGALLGVGYAIAGAPHPALLGALTAVAAVIPMGAPFVLALASALVLGGGSVVAAAVLFGVGMVIIFVADHAVRPALIGGTTRLPFLWVLLGILGGVETFGLLGLFLGPAVMAALILLWRDWTGDVTTAPVNHSDETTRWTTPPQTP